MARRVRIRPLWGLPVVLSLALATPAIAGAVTQASAPGASRPAFVVAVPAVATPRLVPISAREQRRLTQAEFVSFANHSMHTRDLVGVEGSLYRGEFYVPEQETVRRCIVKRESEGRYTAVSPGTPYYGAYQMSAALAEGVTWMLLPEHKELLGVDAAKTILAHLRQTPASEWPRYWQDAAFSTIYNWEREGSGASHWFGGRWTCAA